MSKRVLVVDDEKLIVKGIRFSLEQDDMHVDCAYDGEEALELAQENHYDIILLDLMLPKMDGLEVCQQIRGFSNVPIVMLTAKGEDMDKILGLEYGADDYITKPFKLGELCSRIRAQLRRSGIGDAGGENRLFSGPVSIDPFSGSAYLNNQPLGLTNAEYRLLCLLVRNAGQTVLRNTILDALWDGNGNFVDDNTLSVYIRRLREKIEEDPSNPKHLLTVRGFGYKWRKESG